jgi:single-strand DNA-binding protein
VRDSLHRGEAVIVHGRLRTRTWSRGPGEPDGSALEVEAALIGHDLTRGTSAFLKRQRAVVDEPDLDSEVADMVVAGLADDQPLDSWGNVKKAAESREEPAA